MEALSRQADGKWGLGVYLPGTVARIESVGIERALEEPCEESPFEEV